METPILRTKLYLPQPQPGSLIPCPSLLEKLDKVLEQLQQVGGVFLHLLGAILSTVVAAMMVAHSDPACGGW